MSVINNISEKDCIKRPHVTKNSCLIQEESSNWKTEDVVSQGRAFSSKKGSYLMLAVKKYPAYAFYWVSELNSVKFWRHGLTLQKRKTEARKRRELVQRWQVLYVNSWQS